MCGIAGFLNYSAKGIGARELEEVGEILHHRGPDGAGFVLQSQQGNIFEVTTETYKPRFPTLALISGLPDEPFRAGLLHRRLSIIETGSGGHQPMASPDGQVWLTFNGEIYNYKAIRRKLQMEGISFQTQSDTEVLLKGYLKWGKSVLEHLDGMWAFAILDFRSKEVFASVDRSGIKPFYFCNQPDYFFFASEIKAFTKVSIPFLPNWPKVFRFLSTGSSEEHSEAAWEETMFKSIYRLRAGEELTVSFDHTLPKIRPWHIWKVNNRFDFQPYIKEQKRIETIRELLMEMIALRLQSDVPLGVCLSGGIDSSTIAGLMANAGRRNGSGLARKAFMATVPKGTAHDESGYARLIAEHAGFSFHETQPTAEDFLASLNDFVFTAEEPVPGMNAFSQYSVFRKVAENGVKVTLDGQGADEIFGGYFHQQQVWALEQIRHGVSSPISSKWLIKYLLQKNRLIKSIRQREANWLKPDIFDFDSHNRETQLNSALFQDFTSSTLPFLLKAADRNSMRWSVESRMPFADFGPLIAYLFSLEGSAKIQGAQTKYLLRKSAEPFVPASILNRKDKIGFAAPQNLWLKHIPVGMLYPLVDNLEADLLERNSFLTALNNAHMLSSGQSALLWRTISVLLWHHRVICGKEIGL